MTNNKTNIKRPSIVGLAIVAVVIAVQLAVPRIAVGTSKKLPVTSFPRTLAGWTDTEDRQTDPELKKRLAGSTIVDRIYKRKNQSVDLLLLTSDTLEDFHDPTICFPSQGWAIQGQQNTEISGFPATLMMAKSDRRLVKTIYWFVGDYQSTRAKTPLQKRLYKLRHLVVRREEGTCLFVRIISNSAPGDKSLEDFVTDFRPAIEGLYSAAPNMTPKRQAI